MPLRPKTILIWIIVRRTWRISWNPRLLSRSPGEQTCSQANSWAVLWPQLIKWPRFRVARAHSGQQGSRRPPKTLKYQVRILSRSQRRLEAPLSLKVRGELSTTVTTKTCTGLMKWSILTKSQLGQATSRNLKSKRSSSKEITWAPRMTKLLPSAFSLTSPRDRASGRLLSSKWGSLTFRMTLNWMSFAAAKANSKMWWTQVWRRSTTTASMWSSRVEWKKKFLSCA